MASTDTHDHDEAQLFGEGLRLFNEGRWFDAHEEWEDAWHMAQGRKKKFYQGLIQAAVTIEHLRRGNPRGVRSVYATCLGKFDGLPDVYMGVPVKKLLADLEQTVRPTLDLPAGYFDPARPRGQKLPVDWQNVPKIQLEYDPFKS
jgi:predicted metal-dependent hydrolase